MEVFITYDSQRSLEAITNYSKGEISRFKSFPVLGLTCDKEHIDAIKSLEGVVYVHTSRIRFYQKILEHIDRMCLLPEEVRAGNLLINLSIWPGAGPFIKDEPLNVATRSAAEKGLITVIAAGNGGPQENTLNPWSVAPWVIGVSAADEMGTNLWLNSSIGIPEDDLYHPTVVAPGVNVPALMVPSSESKRFHGTMVASVALGTVDKEGAKLESGTSLAAPVVARLCWYLVKFIDLLHTTDRILKKISSTSAIDVTEAAELSELEPVPAFFNELKAKNVDYRITFSPLVVKGMLELAARPMPGYARHQVGAGFVNDSVVEEFLRKFSPREFLHFFGVGTGSNVGGFEKFGPIMGTDVVSYIIRRVRQGAKALDLPVLDPD